MARVKVPRKHLYLCPATKGVVTRQFLYPYMPISLYTYTVKLIQAPATAEAPAQSLLDRSFYFQVPERVLRTVFP